jgi:transcriptional regulator with XRE-family HTH domain
MAKVHVRKARDLSSALVAARRRRGWSQGEVADRIGVSRDYIGDLESGQLSLQVSRLMRLFGELGVDVVLTLPEQTDEPGAPDA